MVGKNGDCKILQPYVVPDTVKLGGVPVEVLVKEITELEEHIGYQALADYHYRGKAIHGRTARLIIRTFHPKYPKVLGYIELATPFFMNKPRSRIMDAPFKSGSVKWDRWDMATLRQYIHVIVRIARAVVAPEFRGADVGQLLVKHATIFAKSRWQVSGYLPSFLEISADMLKFVPFAERAGMIYVGETEGNLKRVASDMRYLIGRFGQNSAGKTEFESISGIVDQQVARMDRSIEIMKQEDINVDALYSKLTSLSQKTVLKQFAKFHGIVSLPKPHYMIGLSHGSMRFLANRVRVLGISNGHTPPTIDIDPITQPITFNNISIEYCSSVRRTFQTHAVQQAFDISPDNVHSTVIKDLSFTIQPSSIVLVLGPSGSGKTSLLQLLEETGRELDGLVGGEVRLPGNLRAQSFRDFRSEKPLIDAMGEEDVYSALYLLGLAGLSEPALYLKRFRELSKGQQYRAMLAKLMASRSNVWIADEFCANLDPATASIVADSVQRMARRLGVTMLAAAPHCDNFLHSLNPDVVVLLSSSWDHSILRGEDYMKAFGKPTGARGRIPRMHVTSELLQMLRQGARKTTVRRGNRRVPPGLLVVSDGCESMPVRVASSVCKRFSCLSEEDAQWEGIEDSRALNDMAKAMYPTLQERSLVTVIHLEPLLNYRPRPLCGDPPSMNGSVIRG